MADTHIAFIGAGNMASSIVGGLVAQGFPAGHISASDPHPESLIRLQQLAAIKTCSDNAQAVANADVLILAVKPQVMNQVCRELRAELAGRPTLIISIAAGIQISSLEQWLGSEHAIVRCMPNTPALVRSGATALYANAQVSAAQRQLADRILSAVGLAEWVEQESELDAVTAVSGSGPAYFFLVMEAMENAATELGLAPDLARKLTLQTALGAAQMALDSDLDVAELRRRVTSPGGTTERAIHCFEEQGLRALFNRAMTAARDRSAELAQLMDSE